MRKILMLSAAIFFLMSTVALADHIFSDVPDTHTHATGIHWAAENEVVRGFPDGTFRPRDNIQRGQAATMFRQYHDVVEGLLDDLRPEVTARAARGEPTTTDVPPGGVVVLTTAAIDAPRAGGAVYVAGGGTFTNDGQVLGGIAISPGGVCSGPYAGVGLWQMTDEIDFQSAHSTSTFAVPEGQSAFSLCAEMSGPGTVAQLANLELIWVPDGGQLASARLQDEEGMVEDLLDPMETQRDGSG